MFNPPPLGPPSTERPQNRRTLLGAQHVYTLQGCKLRADLVVARLFRETLTMIIFGQILQT